MKLRPVIKKELKKPEQQDFTEKRPPSKKKENKLPPAEYQPMFQPIRFLVRETFSSKDATKVIKQYIELSVKRYDGDDENAPMVYIQMYQESDFYTGYLKGKTVYLPLEMLYDFIDNLSDLSEECEKLKIE